MVAGLPCSDWLKARFQVRHWCAWQESLREEVSDAGLDWDLIWKHTDPSDQMEGLYIKVEEGGTVSARYKFIRADFLTAVLDSGTHWLRRPIVPNLIAEGD